VCQAGGVDADGWVCLMQTFPLDRRLVEPCRRLRRIAGPVQVIAEIPSGLGQLVPQAVAIWEIFAETRVQLDGFLPRGNGPGRITRTSVQNGDIIPRDRQVAAV